MECVAHLCIISDTCCIGFQFQTDIEWADYISTYQVQDENRNGNYTKFFESDPRVHDYPEAIDWRTKGAVTPIKDQVYSYKATDGYVIQRAYSGSNFCSCCCTHASRQFHLATSIETEACYN